MHPDHKKIATATDVHGQKVLATVKPELFETGYKIKLDEQTLLAEELNDQALRKFNNDSRNETIATHWNKNAELFGQTLVFAVSVEHANALARAFGKFLQHELIQVVHTGSIPPSIPSRFHPKPGSQLTRKNRSQIHKQFHARKIKILIAMNIYTMGVDFPSIQTLFMARPTLSPVLYAQMVGRGMRGRAFGGTEFVTVVDFVDQKDPHEKLIKRIMNFQNQEEWTNRMYREFREVKKLIDDCLPHRVADIRGKMKERSGVYRAISSRDKSPLPNRDWKMVNDIGKSIEDLRSSDMVQYILQSDREAGETIVQKLKRWEPWLKASEERESDPQLGLSMRR